MKKADDKCSSGQELQRLRRLYKTYCKKWCQEENDYLTEATMFMCESLARLERLLTPRKVTETKWNRFVRDKSRLGWPMQKTAREWLHRKARGKK